MCLNIAILNPVNPGQNYSLVFTDGKASSSSQDHVASGWARAQHLVLMQTLVQLSPQLSKKWLGEKKIFWALQRVMTAVSIYTLSHAATSIFYTLASLRPRSAQHCIQWQLLVDKMINWKRQEKTGVSVIKGEVAASAHSSQNKMSSWLLDSCLPWTSCFDRQKIIGMSDKLNLELAAMPCGSATSINIHG